MPRGRERICERVRWVVAAALLLAGLALAAPPASAAAASFTDDAASVDRVLELADERLTLMPAVAAWKWRKHSPIEDIPREQLVIRHAVALGQPLGLSPEGVRGLFELQIRMARDLQRNLQAHWRLHGFDFPEPLPSLETELRPHLDRLTPDLLRAVYAALPVFERPGFVNEFEAAAAEHLHAPGWSPATRRELLAALARIRAVPAPATARIAAAGLIRIGTTGDYAPFSFESQGRLAGADIELARALAQHLGVEPRFVRTTWGTLLEDLRAGRFDLAMGGISLTPERKAAAAFSVGYATGGKTIIARCNDAQRFSSLAALDRRGVRLIVNSGGSNQAFMSARVHRAEVRVVADNRTIFDELVAGRADAMVTDDVEVELQTRRHPQLCRTLPGTLTHTEKAILLPRGSDLVRPVDAWLARELATGVPARLLGEYLDPAHAD